MGKVTPKEKRRGRRNLRGSGKYLKPGTLAQLLCNRSLGLGSGSAVGRVCNDIGKKRVEILYSDKSEGCNEGKVFDKSPLMLSPVNLVKGSGLVGTPKTPRIEECQSDSRLESLPIDLLVIASNN
jgi:hypothetical protein